MMRVTSSVLLTFVNEPYVRRYNNNSEICMVEPGESGVREYGGRDATRCVHEQRKRDRHRHRQRQMMEWLEGNCVLWVAMMGQRKKKENVTQH